MSLLQHDSGAFKLISKTPGSVAAMTLGAVAATWLLLSSLKRDSSKEGLKEIPTPKGAIPYFGHLFSLGEVPVLQFNKWHKELGTIIRVRMGVKEWVSISDPHLAHQVLGVNTTITAARPHTTFLCDFHALKDKGISGANPSSQWKKTRSATISILSPRNRDQLEKLHGPEAELLIEHLVNATVKDGSVAVADPLHFASLNVVFTTCFGRRAESTEDPLFKEVSFLMNQTGKRSSPAEEISTFLPIMTILDIIFRRKQDMRKFIYEKRNPAFRRYIQDAVDSGVECFAKAMLETKGIDDYDNVIVTMADAIIAGTDTTAVSLEWSMNILCRYPEVQKRMRDEIDQFIHTHGRLPTFEDRDSVPYSVSVQKECMRYRPITFFGLPHEASQDIVANGYLIPKGASIVCDMYSLHRNEEFYPDAEKFKPERYLGDRKPMYTSANMPANVRDHFNFGWGRRVCPGAYLAELQIFNVWVRLYAKCIIEPPVDGDGKPKYPDIENVFNAGITMKPYKSALRVIKRSDALI